jgi:hypothetical protein
LPESATPIISKPNIDNEAGQKYPTEIGGEENHNLITGRNLNRQMIKKIKNTFVHLLYFISSNFKAQNKA